MTMNFRMARNRGSSDDGFAFSTRRVTRSASKQQHGEGKEQKKPVCGPPWREFADEELEAYKKKAEESEGFDVGEVPEDVFMAIILPCPLDEPASALRPYNKMAKKALAAYNNEKGTTYKFVKHIRVSLKGGGRRCWFYEFYYLSGQGLKGWFSELPNCRVFLSGFD